MCAMEMPCTCECIVHNHGSNVSTVVWSGASGKKQLKNLATGEGRPRIAL